MLKKLKTLPTKNRLDVLQRLLEKRSQQIRESLASTDVLYKIDLLEKVNMSHAGEVVFKSDEHELYRSIGGDSKWKTFALVFNYHPKKKKFRIGWNGSRFAEDHELKNFNKFSPEILAHLEIFLRNHYFDGAIEFDSAVLEMDWIEQLEATRITKELATPSKTIEDAKRKQRQPEIAHQKAQEAQTLNESRQFDLLIFDLDDTMLATGHLDAFRGKEFIGPQNVRYKADLAIYARSLECLVSEELLLSLQSDFPSMALSIFTRAPRDYASILLETRFPRVKWDSIVAFEDVAHTKPHPDGIYLAAREANVKCTNRVALVGDGKVDILAAYQAGITAVLLNAGWTHYWSSKRDPIRTDHYKTLQLMPDAILPTANDLIRLVTNPLSLLPSLETWNVNPEFAQLLGSMRIDKHKHFNNLVEEEHPSWIEIHAMGRYFPKLSSSSQYDFTQREQLHLLNKVILDAKGGIAYPESWAKCCANFINKYANDILRNNKSLMVCSIPSSPESVKRLGSNRLTALFKAIEIQLNGQCNVIFSCETLRYKPGASSNKTLERDARFVNVRDNMFVADISNVRGMAILVIDDVSTSGATFFYANRYLMQAGARSVRCLALTQTISSLHDH